MIAWLDDNNVEFPPTQNAEHEPNGLLAAGGDLSYRRLINAYKQGIFPWYEEGQPILWWSPTPRCVMLTDQIHISKSLAKFIRKTDMRCTFNQAFEQVITACAAPRNYTDDTWITDAMMDAYIELSQQGIAHSIEVWQEDQLVGGLYGLRIGQMFFGESMFSTKTNASKIAIVQLCRSMQQANMPMLDCQVSSDHLLSLGATLLPRQTFENKLAELVNQTASKPLKPADDMTMVLQQ